MARTCKELVCVVQHTLMLFELLPKWQKSAGFGMVSVHCLNGVRITSIGLQCTLVTKSCSRACASLVGMPVAA